MITSKEVLDAIEHSHATKSLMQDKLKGIVPDVSFKFWERILSTTESVVLLAQSGFVLEAMAIQRLSIEHFAIVVGLLQREVTLDELVRRSHTDLAVWGEKLHQQDERDFTLTLENKEKLAIALEDMKREGVVKPGLNTHNILSAGGLGHLYDNRYRLLSAIAAHSTLLGAVRPNSDEDVAELFTFAFELLQLLDASAKKASSEST